MTNLEKARNDALKPIIRFHWEKSRLKKKSGSEGDEKAVYKLTINFQKARRFSEKSKKHEVKVIGKPVCEIPPSRSIIKNAHSQGGEIGEVYIGRQIIIEGKDLSLCPHSQAAHGSRFKVKFVRPPKGK